MKIAIFGNGGHAKEVACQMSYNGTSEVTFFVDDEYVSISTLPISKFDPNEYSIMVAVSNPKDREDIIKRLPHNTQYFSFIHPTAQIMNSDVVIGDGSFIGANSIITCNVKIGKHAILNRGNHIGHDCRIGDYFSAMPGSIVSGNVEIGDRVYIGTNSSIREKIKICNDVTIGLSTGIVKDIVEPGIYVGDRKL